MTKESAKAIVERFPPTASFCVGTMEIWRAAKSMLDLQSNATKALRAKSSETCRATTCRRGARKRKPPIQPALRVCPPSNRRLSRGHLRMDFRAKSPFGIPPDLRSTEAHFRGPSSQRAEVRYL